jgi:hypothetical protein
VNTPTHMPGSSGLGLMISRIFAAHFAHCAVDSAPLHHEV